MTVAAIITLISVVASLVWVMFASHPGDPRALGFFGAVFFESKSRDDGALDIGFGLENGFPVLIAFVVLTVLVLAVSVVTARLRAYKHALSQAPSE